ncbi:SNF2-related protein [Nitzschia inconspicua]|uniref:SNF2-related protein n=1 Tax=Nitzschia inconspicua TaxID=303405 RepID=A0A9K3KK99_9STRA|nr:SNF2-related protein [Nitzschia inconspicua]
MGKRDNSKNGGNSSSNSNNNGNIKSTSSSSIIEKLQMLRSFVGESSGFSESDLSTCLRQSGFMVEVAAERFMTGQFQPSKKAKTTALSTGIPSNSSYTASSTDSASVATPSEKSTQTKRSTPSPPHIQDTSTPHSKSDAKLKATPTSTTATIHANTLSVPPKNSMKSSVLVTPRTATPDIKHAPWKSAAWMLCHRWVSDGTNLSRNGACQYQEELVVSNVAADTSASSMLRFRGTSMQGSFPKHLSVVLVPLLQANVIQLEASALMEERDLNVGAHVPFSLTVWITQPLEFFAIFDQTSSYNTTYSKQFFAKAAADTNSSTKNKARMTPAEAAFSLLEWAQHGQPLEDLIENYASNSNADSDLEDDEEVVQDEAHDGVVEQEEEEMPEWAQTVINGRSDSLDDEMDTPRDLKVDLRPYQKQALNWMTHREAKPSGHWKSDQLQLLTELAQLAKGKSSREISSQSKASVSISCDCGPVLVDQRSIAAPAVGTLSSSFFENPNTDEQTFTSKDDTHPLWERRFLCNATKTRAISFFVQPLFRTATSIPPPAPSPCRGGILADSMGLGKTVMLLALVQACKNQVEVKNFDTRWHGTLVVTPLSLVLQWETEIETKTSLSHRVYYGDNRKQSLGFDDVDVVLTTYGSLQAEYQRHRHNRNDSSSKLLSKNWKRIILDECHYIKNPSTLAAKACGRLDAERRWCVSGTIIQNSLEDVYSLMKFLRHQPWCEHGFWKAAVTTAPDTAIALDRVKRVLTPIMIRRTKESIDKEGKPILMLPEINSKTVMVEFTQSERQFYEALYRKSFEVFHGFIRKGTASTSYFKIFSIIQRLRQTCSHVALTVKSRIDEEDWNFAFAKEDAASKPDRQPIDPTEEPEDSIDRSFLESLLSKFRSMQRATSAGSGAVNEESNLAYLTSMAHKLNSAVMSQSSELNEECPICLDTISLETAVVTPCLHVFCQKCLLETMTFSGDKSTKPNHFASMKGDCPSCSEPVLFKKLLRLSQEGGKFVPEFFLEDAGESRPKPVASAAPNSNDDLDARNTLQTAVNGSSSSKLEAILQELDMVWSEEPGSKVLIFSQFLGFLDVMEREFASREISFARLDGKLSLKERMAVIQEFGSESAKSEGRKGSVLLISMKAGGVGLNLVSANTVFIADPWWNGAVEQQCIDRIHRIGQQAKEVRVRRFCVANSIEERILELQERKKNIASAALRDGGTSSHGEASRPSLEDFKLLFQEVKNNVMMKEKQL